MRGEFSLENVLFADPAEGPGSFKNTDAGQITLATHPIPQSVQDR
jgi:hypothetical protein